MEKVIKNAGISNEALTNVVQKAGAGDITELWEFILEDRDSVMHKTVKVKNTFLVQHCLWEYFREQIC